MPMWQSEKKYKKNVTVLDMLMFTMVFGSVLILALAAYSIILWRRLLKTERKRKQTTRSTKKTAT